MTAPAMSKKAAAITRAVTMRRAPWSLCNRTCASVRALAPFPRTTRVPSAIAWSWPAPSETLSQLACKWQKLFFWGINLAAVKLDTNCRGNCHNKTNKTLNSTDENWKKQKSKWLRVALGILSRYTQSHPSPPTPPQPASPSWAPGDLFVRCILQPREAQNFYEILWQPEHGNLFFIYYHCMIILLSCGVIIFYQFFWSISCFNHLGLSCFIILFESNMKYLVYWIYYWHGPSHLQCKIDSYIYRYLQLCV